MFDVFLRTYTYESDKPDMCFFACMFCMYFKGNGVCNLLSAAVIFMFLLCLQRMRTSSSWTLSQNNCTVAIYHNVNCLLLPDLWYHDHVQTVFFLSLM